MSRTRTRRLLALAALAGVVCCMIAVEVPEAAAPLFLDYDPTYGHPGALWVEEGRTPAFGNMEAWSAEFPPPPPVQTAGFFEDIGRMIDNLFRRPLFETERDDAFTWGDK